jgi:uncharacterized membrane protein
MKLPEECKAFGVLTAVIFIGAIIAGIFVPGIKAWLGLGFGIWLYFFVPGYTLLLLLELDSIERSIFAFPAGAIMTSLMLYVFNLFGIALTTMSVVVAVVIVTAISLFFWYKKRKNPVSHAS